MTCWQVYDRFRKENYMEQEKSNRLASIIFFTMTAAVFVCFSYLIVESAQEGPALDTSVPSRTVAGSAYIPEYSVDSGTLVLGLDKETRVNTKHFVFRGIEDGSIMIEVFIPALDPKVGYMYKVSIDEAEKGFNLSGYACRLISVRKHRIKVELAA